MRPAVSTEYIENGSRPRCRPTAPTTRRGNAARDAARVIGNFRARGGSRTWNATSTRCSPAVPGGLGPFRMRTNFQIQALSSLFFRNKGAYAVGQASSTASTRCPSRCRSCTTPDGFRFIDAALFGGRPADAVQLRARRLHGRHGGAFGLRAVPALDDAAQAAQRALQRDLGLQKQGKNICSTATSSPTCATRATISASRRASGHGDAGVRPAELPRVFKVIKDFYPRKETTRESSSRASTCW